MSPFWTYGDLVFMAILYLPLSAAGTILLRHRAGGLLAGQLIGYVAWFLVLALLFRIKYGRPFGARWDGPRPHIGFREAL
jgi:hypothetical protein